MATPSYLQNLNEAQYRAVTSTPAGALQILAGPGSGKTRVLTCRVANLIIGHEIPAPSICAVTFTNKAAAEMRVRLTRLVGPSETSRLVIGTFHAICANYLRKYGTAIGLATNFSICDSDESKKTISTLLQKHTSEIESIGLDLKEPIVRSMISKAKATGQTPQEMLRIASSVSTQDKIQAAVALIYEEYDAVLRAANALDFDDLLVMGLKVLKAAPRAIAKLRHVLVDEFQDTNTMQYELMRVLADACGRCVSVVGDPDQSIYGWRSADVTNLSRMRKDFPGTNTIYLEENYRSTGSIVSSSLAIVSQGTLFLLASAHNLFHHKFQTSNAEFGSATEEASFLARELRRVVASSGGMIGYGDCAVLLRFNALSRVIESALQQESVPSRVLGGHKFFERAEVKDLLVYLQLADNPAFTPAFVRAVNVPKRGVGEKSVAEIVSRASSEKTSAFNVIERICDGMAPDIKPPIKRKVSELVRLIRQLRKWASEGVLAADLIRRTVDDIGYEAHLQRTQPDWETRWENVQELINFAAGVELPEPEVLNSEDEGDYLEHDVGAYPSESEELAAGSTTLETMSSSKPGSTKGLAATNPQKQAGKLLARSSGSQGRDTITMKQATLSSWRSASRPNSTLPQPQQPEPLDDDVLDLTGTDDEEISSEKLIDGDVPTKKLLQPRRDNQQTPLRAFLQASLLSTDSETKEEESKGKVTITTCHAAKGLEWPVVIVPAVEGGTYPFYRAEDVEEERMYPSTSIAVPYPLELQNGWSFVTSVNPGETRKTTLSEFVTCIIQQDLRNLPLLTKDELVVFGKILSRAVPSNEVIQKGLREFRRVPRLRDHERDEPVDIDEASNPSWKYTANESGNASRAARPSSIAASHEGFTTFSLASVRSFDQVTTAGSKKVRMNVGDGATGTPRLSSSTNSGQTIKPKSASGLAYLSRGPTASHSSKQVSAQAKPLSSSTIGTSTSKVAVAPPKPANSAFRPPTFIANGATPNAASAVAGAKRRLGMGHFAGGALSAQKFRQVEKGVKSGNDT
ncbi:UvrD-helicase domain protein [Rhizoctonia solani]|uniref:DNA 3'-5' helicase n=1 Tax=Rhizoctonia solani TaxID=456999 RepID=A0A8H8NY33_9AGAM|nr:UvrD-helicase domain protein [Rhizoctonia solani]QRW22246.1 UvrD-helicase domain protein [Rhizoctonia solani]